MFLFCLLVSPPCVLSGDLFTKSNSQKLLERVNFLVKVVENLVILALCRSTTTGCCTQKVQQK